MNTIAEIYDKIYFDNSTKEGGKFISIIEPNEKIFHKHSFINDEEKERIKRLISDYAIILLREGYTKKSLPFLNQAIELWNKEAKGINLLDYDLYKSLIWSRGEAYYYLYNYKLAKRDFKRLAQKWPDNDRYINWYNASLKKENERIIWIFYLLIAIPLILKYLFEFDHELFVIPIAIGVIGSLILNIYEYYNKIKIK